MTMHALSDLPKLEYGGDARLWLDAGLWPDGPNVPLQNILCICGSPRSGTTWLHNTLIGCGRFRGIQADDMADVGPDPFFTDENRYLHTSLIQATVASAEKNAAKLTFQAICYLIYLRFGVAGELMLKSPYYAFFLDKIYESGLCNKFIFMHRDPDLIALSMLEHPHVSRLLAADFEQSHDVVAGSSNIEIRHVDASLLTYFTANYAKLSFFDRALFKAITFGASFAFHIRNLQNAEFLVLNYDTFFDDNVQHDRLRLIAKLDDVQWKIIEGSFRPSRSRESKIPAHDPGFRRAILDIEKAFLSSLMPR
jgi:Sulfotransferase family